LIALLVASMTTPSAAFSRNQREFRVAAAMEQLSEDSRQALRMRYLESLPTKEIAQRMQKTDGAVRVLLTRSLQRLQKILEESNYTES
jgi:RNA polymerase sigma-70 factor (ECF subfamily)